MWQFPIAECGRLSYSMLKNKIFGKILPFYTCYRVHMYQLSLNVLTPPYFSVCSFLPLFLQHFVGCQYDHLLKKFKLLHKYLSHWTTFVARNLDMLICPLLFCYCSWRKHVCSAVMLMHPDLQSQCHFFFHLLPIAWRK